MFRIFTGLFTSSLLEYLANGMLEETWAGWTKLEITSLELVSTYNSGRVVLVSKVSPLLSSI